MALDGGTNAERAWDEFRVSFSSTVAWRLLLEDMRDFDAAYFGHLCERISAAVGQGYAWDEDPASYEEMVGESWDGYVPVQGATNRSVTFIPWEEAEVLEDQLLLGEATSHAWQTFGFIVVAVHAAVESYARALGVTGPQLPQAIAAFLEKPPDGAPMGTELYVKLVDLDATRHIFVHNRGVVDERYVNAVTGNHFLVNERRVLNGAILDTFSRTAWQIALLLHARSVLRGQ